MGERLTVECENCIHRSGQMWTVVGGMERLRCDERWITVFPKKHEPSTIFTEGMVCPVSGTIKVKVDEGSKAEAK